MIREASGKQGIVQDIGSAGNVAGKKEDEEWQNQCRA